MLEVLSNTGGLGKDGTSDPRYLKLLMPAIRADLKMLATYRHTEQERLSCPITVLSGTQDMLFSMEDLHSWREVTSRAFKVEQVPGDHLFIKGIDRSPIAKIRRELEECTLPVFSECDE